MLENLIKDVKAQNTRIWAEVQHHSKLIDEKAWQDKDLQMTKAEVLAEFHILLGKSRALEYVLNSIEMGEYK